MLEIIYRTNMFVSLLLLDNIYYHM